MTPEIAAVAENALIGHCIDERYRLEAVIGVGGLGSVYRAIHTKLQRPVAVKLLHESFGESQIQRGRFAREAKALAALQHPNIVAVLDYGVSDAQPYLVMELLEGETLSQRLHDGPLPLASALQTAQQLLEALSFMHRARLVHRDVKPSNVFLLREPDGRDRIKVLDFGLAKFTSAPMVSTDPTLTRDGAILGTPAYMSPEQATGEIVDARSDVYAVGVILFRMLTGRLPFEGDAIEQVRSHLIAPVPPLVRPQPDPEIDRVLEALIGRAMAKRREDRYVDAGQMLRALVESFPQYVHPTLPEHEPVLPDPFAVDALNADWLLSVTDASSETTRPRDTRAPAEFTRTRESVHRVGRAMRTVVVTSVRLFAGVSVLLVVGAGAIFVLLLRNDADRVELTALQRRVQDRFLERSRRGVSTAPLAGAPTAAEPTDPRLTDSDSTAKVTLPAAGASVTQDIAGSGSQALVAAAPAVEAPGAAPAQTAGASNPAAPEPKPTLEPMALPRDLETSLSPIEHAGADQPPGPPLSDRLAAALEKAGNAGAAVLALEPPLPRLDPQPSAARASDSPASAAIRPERVRAVDPWQEPVPPKLRAARKTVLANGRGSESMVLALRAYNREQRTDARGHLLLGQLYLNRYWRADALSQFSIALSLDPSARGAPEVLAGLLALVIHGELAPQASRVILSQFGAEAVSATDAALARQKDSKPIARLRWLRSRLATVQPPQSPQSKP